MKNAFRVVSLFEGLSYIGLMFVGMVLKYQFGDPSVVKALGMPHGLLFVAYLVMAGLIKDDMKWDMKTFGIVLVASILPFGTFYIDRKYLSK